MLYLNEYWQHGLLIEHVQNSGAAVTWHAHLKITEMYLLRTTSESSLNTNGSSTTQTLYSIK